MKKIFIVICLLCLFPGMALASSDTLGLSYAGDIGLEKAVNIDLKSLLVTIIRYILSFVGITSTATIVLAGVKWMVSAGDKDRVAAAKQTMTGAMIGIVVILSSYAIVTSVVDSWDSLVAGDWHNIANADQTYGPWD